MISVTVLCAAACEGANTTTVALTARAMIDDFMASTVQNVAAYC
jgi:hypothetical protein